MKNDYILTTKELADYLKLNEKTIIKMAQAGNIPGVKIGNQWRFHLSSINDYLLTRSVKSASGASADGLVHNDYDIIPLSRLTKEDRISLDLKAGNKDEALGELAELAQKAGLADSSINVYNELRNREEMLSTAIGGGIALPHPRDPGLSQFKKVGVIIGRSKDGVEFSSPDNKKVYLFFMPCASDVVVHLKLLAKISSLFHRRDVFRKIMQASTKDEIIKILLEAERFGLSLGL